MATSWQSHADGVAAGAAAAVLTAAAGQARRVPNWLGARMQAAGRASLCWASEVRCCQSRLWASIRQGKHACGCTQVPQPACCCPAAFLEQECVAWRPQQKCACQCMRASPDRDCTLPSRATMQPCAANSHHAHCRTNGPPLVLTPQPTCTFPDYPRRHSGRLSPNRLKLFCLDSPLPSIRAPQSQLPLLPQPSLLSRFCIAIR